MVGFLRRLIGGGGGAAAPVRGGKRFDAALEIDRPTYAVGDVHGRDDLLARLLPRLAEDAAAQGFEAPRLVLMGDYVDRGEQSAEVLERVAGLCAGHGGWPGEVQALRGNHEQMLLDFLDAPQEEGPRWLRNGGLQTLLSFGVGGVAPNPGPEDLDDIAARLRAAAGPLEDMLRDLPLSLRHGNVLFAHAGADPDLPAAMQPDRVLLWGSSRFHQLPRTDGVWVVYGHYVVDEAGPSAGRVATDTGAYHTGVLSAVRLAEGAVGVLTSAG